MNYNTSCRAVALSSG